LERRILIGRFLIHGLILDERDNFDFSLAGITDRSFAFVSGDRDRLPFLSRGISVHPDEPRDIAETPYQGRARD
jgi:hypothetical protein